VVGVVAALVLMVLPGEARAGAQLSHTACNVLAFSPDSCTFDAPPSGTAAVAGVLQPGALWSLTHQIKRYVVTSEGCTPEYENGTIAIETVTAIDDSGTNDDPTPIAINQSEQLQPGILYTGSISGDGGDLVFGSPDSGAPDSSPTGGPDDQTAGVEPTICSTPLPNPPEDPNAGLPIAVPGHGTIAQHTTNDVNPGAPTIQYSYVMYMPAGWNAGDRWPLVVAIHGCGSSAWGQMSVDKLNVLADREHFLVLRPDNQANCWRAVSDDALGPSMGLSSDMPDSTRGLGGDVDIVAGMTTRVIADYGADANRVYIMGFSAGAFQASHSAGAYPDLYAAVGSSEGGGPGMAITCVGYPQAVAPKYAQLAVQAMGTRAHLMPFIAVAGGNDPIGEGGVAGCSRMAFWEWVSINSILTPSPAPTLSPGDCAALPANATCADAWTVDPASTETGTVPHGHSWTREVARGEVGGCEIAENWAVDGMGHAWSGGDPSDASAGVNTSASDPQGPDLSQLAWDFFSKFSLDKEYAATASPEEACTILTSAADPSPDVPEAPSPVLLLLGLVPLGMFVARRRAASRRAAADPV
jgi:poly(3-hydroxybutyrate) depolymerase